MSIKCICNSRTGITCALHERDNQLEHICVRCGHKRGDHMDPQYGSTVCSVTGGCRAKCKGFVGWGDLEGITLQRGPQPPTEEAIAEARYQAGNLLRSAIAASHIKPSLMDEALEAIAEFVWMRNGAH